MGMMKAKTANDREEELTKSRRKRISKVTGKMGASGSYQKRRQWNWLFFFNFLIIF